MVFLIIPVGGIISAARALSSPTNSQASSNTNSAASSASNSPQQQQQPPAFAPPSPLNSPVFNALKPRLIVADDSIQVDPRDVHLIVSPPGLKPSAPAANIEQLELQEKKEDSSSETLPTASTPAASASPYLLYYRLLDAEGHVWYSGRLRPGNNHPDVGCQFCTADPKGECPCFTSCGFDVQFDANVQQITTTLPAPPPPPTPPPMLQGQQQQQQPSGIRGFFKSVAQSVNEVGVPAGQIRVLSQQVELSYQQCEGQGPVRQRMELNAVTPIHVYTPHHDFCCVVFYIHIVSRLQKSMGVQLVAMSKEDGDKMTQECTWYSYTAC